MEAPALRGLGARGEVCTAEELELELQQKPRWHRTRTNTNPNDTKANAAGRSGRACVAQSDGRRGQGGGSEFSGLWVCSLKCVCRVLKTGNDRKKE